MAYMAWVRGETGHTFSRQGAIKLNAFQHLCREYAPQAFNLLREIVEDSLQEGSVRIQGLKFMVEHAYGKARQSIDIKHEESIIPGDMTSEQLRLAAAGQTEELVCSLIASGKLNEYTRGYEYEGIAIRKEKDITKVKDDHLGDKPEVKRKSKLKSIKSKKGIKS